MPEYSNYVESRDPVVTADGTELIAVSKDGEAASMTAQQIADLGGGGGGSGTVESVTGNGVDNTDPDNPVITDVNAAVVLTDAATIDLTAIKHTLTTSSSRTFTISYTGDDISMRITLNATSATQTFPAGAKCITEGAATGDNTCPMAGTSGDTYAISIKHWGSGVYTVICKNEDQ